MRAHESVVLALCLGIVTASAAHNDGEFLYDITQEECVHNKSTNLEAQDIKLEVYDFETNVNITTFLRTGAGAMTDFYDIDYSRPLVVFVPGFFGDEVITWAKQAFQQTPKTYLAIIDHSQYIGNTLNKDTFLNAVYYSYAIGRQIGQFLVDLNDAGFPSKNITVISHAFSGPIGGYAAEIYQQETGEKPGRLTALNPVRLCFDHETDSVRSGLAEYVDIYQCTFNFVKPRKDLGDVDFHLNQDMDLQPGCAGGINVPKIGHVGPHLCSHFYCAKAFLSTLNRQDLYPACSSNSIYKDGICDSGEETIAGYYSPKSSRGVFYVSTQDSGVDVEKIAIY